MTKNLQQTLKTVLISSLVSASVLIWYNIFGAKFLLAIVVGSLIIVLTSKTKDA